MAEFFIKDEDLTGLKDNVVIITGASSGIGLATAQLLLSLGALVVGADVQPPLEPLDSSAFTFQKTNVTEWSELLALFKKTMELHGRVDHVFANAGISPRANYLATDLDENGDLKRPTFEVLDVNLRAAMETATLAVYYMRERKGGVGSIVITASISSMQRFRTVDYATSKHGVLGFVRGMHQQLEHNELPIRINAVAPSWTRTGVVPAPIMDKLGIPMQPPSEVARGVALLMADETRTGHLVYIAEGRYKEVDEAVLLPAYEKGIMLEGAELEGITTRRITEAVAEMRKNQV